MNQRIVTIVSLLLALVPLTGCSPSSRFYRASSSSMSPTIATGDRFILDQSEQDRTHLHDGDIVAFPREEGAIVIKRILAMPGETISGEDRKIFRDGRQVDEPYLAPANSEQEITPTFPARKVPPGELFVLGDNRDHSFDSRAPEYPPVHLTDVVGKYSLTYWRAGPSKQP